MASINNAHSSSFYKSKIARKLLFLEAGLLVLQGRNFNKEWRFWSEVTASAFTTAAAGVELLAVGTEIALSQIGQQSLTGRSSLINLGKYRLSAFGLALAGGIVSMYWDIQDVSNSYQETVATKNARKSILTVAYTSRIATTLILLGAQGSIVFSQAGALLTLLGIKTPDNTAKLIFKSLAKQSIRLAANRAVLLLLGSALWVGGLIFIGATLVILILDHHALEKGCHSSAYKISNSSNRYDNLQEELKELLKSIQETA